MEETTEISCRPKRKQNLNSFHNDMEQSGIDKKEADSNSSSSDAYYQSYEDPEVCFYTFYNGF